MQNIIIVIAIVLVVAGLAFLGGCATANQSATSQPTVVMNAVDVGATMMMVQLGAQATKQAADMQVEINNAQFTATAQAVGATATIQAQATQAVQAQQTQQAIIAITSQARRDAQATEQQHRADLAATQQIYDDRTATAVAATAAYRPTSDAATAYWNALTVTAVPTSAYLTQVADIAKVNEIKNNEQLQNLQVQSAQQGNWVKTFLPSILGTIVILVGAYFVFRWSWAREFRNKETGGLDMVLVGANVIKPKALPKSIINLKTLEAPDFGVSPAERLENSKLAHATEMLEVMPTLPPTPQATDLMNSIFGNGGDRKNQFEILDEDQAPPSNLLTPEALSSLEKDWKEAKDDDKN